MTCVWGVIMALAGKAFGGQSVDALTSTRTTSRILTPLEGDLFRALVITRADLDARTAELDGCSKKLAARDRIPERTIPPPAATAASPVPPLGLPVAAGLAGLGGGLLIGGVAGRNEPITVVGIGTIGAAALVAIGTAIAEWWD